MAEIKETLELLDGIEVIAVLGGSVFADGKINLADLTKLTSLLTEFDKLKAAVQGISGIKEELKDLDSSEINDLAQKALQIVSSVKTALASA